LLKIPSPPLPSPPQRKKHSKGPTNLCNKFFIPHQKRKKKKSPDKPHTKWTPPRMVQIHPHMSLIGRSNYLPFRAASSRYDKKQMEK
jgi:hypothetical protein